MTLIPRTGLAFPFEFTRLFDHFCFFPLKATQIKVYKESVSHLKEKKEKVDELVQQRTGIETDVAEAEARIRELDDQLKPIKVV